MQVSKKSSKEQDKEKRIRTLLGFQTAEKPILVRERVGVHISVAAAWIGKCSSCKWMVAGGSGTGVGALPRAGESANSSK